MIVRERMLSDLTPHPDNARIYGDAADDALIVSIRQRGILEPLLVTEDGTVIAGHRRLRAARMLGLGHAPCVEFEGDDLAAIEALVESNRQRVKTPEQVAREGMTLLGVERERARRRMIAGVATDPGVTLPQGRGKSRDVVASKVGVSGRTLEKAVAVVEAIDAPGTPPEQAAALRKRLNGTGKGSGVQPAYAAARKAGLVALPSTPVVEIEPPIDDTDHEDRVLLLVGDATRLPLGDGAIDLIVTSPPYGLDKPYLDADDTAKGWIDFMHAWLVEAHRVSKRAGRLALNVPLDTTRPTHRPVYAQAVDAAIRAGWDYRATVVWSEGNISKSTARGSVDSPASPHVIAPVEMIALFSKGDWGRSLPRGITPDLEHDEWLAWTNGHWTFAGENRPWEDHPAAFPPEMPRRLIKLLSFPGDVVLDPFVGSGTTALVAVQLGRRFVGIDSSGEYVAATRRRLSAR